MAARVVLVHIVKVRVLVPQSESSSDAKVLPHRLGSTKERACAIIGKARSRSSKPSLRTTSYGVIAQSVEQ
jgi:hypothetical protein